MQDGGVYYPQVTHVLSGNTAGEMATISSGTFTLAGGNNITLSQAGNAVTISGGAGGGNFSAGMSTQGNTLGDTGYASQRLNLVGGNNITLSGSTNGGSMSLTISGPNPSAAAVTFGMSNLGNTAGTSGTVNQQFLVIGSDGIIGSQSVNGASATLSIINSWSTATTVSSVASANAVGANAGRFALEGHQHEGVFAAGVSNVGVTAGNTGTKPGRFVFAGSGGITASQETAANALQTIHIQGPSIATTVSSVGTANAVGAVTQRYALEDHVHQGVYAAGVSNVGTTAGNTGTKPGQFVFAGSGGITVSQETAANSLQTMHFQGPVSATTISAVASANVIGTRGTRFALEDHQHAGLNTISVVGNTAGNTTAGAGSLVLAGGPNITLSGATAAGGMTLSISGGAGGGGGAFTAGMSNLGNTSGTTGTASARALFAGSKNITIEQSVDAGNGSATLSIHGLGPPTISFWQNQMHAATGNAAYTAILATSNANMVVFPLTPTEVFPGNMTVSTMLMEHSWSATATASSFTSSLYFGLYSLADASKLTLVTSRSTSFSATNSITERLHGIRKINWDNVTDITLSQGSYWVGLVWRSSNYGHTCSHMGYKMGHSAIRSGFIGVTMTSGNSSMPGHMPFHGLVSFTTSGIPNSIHRSDMSIGGNGSVGCIPHVCFNNLAGLMG